MDLGIIAPSLVFRGVKRPSPEDFFSDGIRNDGHSFKFAAQLQHVHQGDKPVLIRIETRAGHGSGKPTAMIIEEHADVYAFLAEHLGM